MPFKTLFFLSRSDIVCHTFPFERNPQSHNARSPNSNIGPPNSPKKSVRRPRADNRQVFEWEEEGLLVVVHQHLLALLEEQGKLRLDETFLDGTFIPSKKGECTGKTRVGKGSMIMLVVDGNGIALNVEVESASTHEGHVAEQIVDGIKVKKHRTHSRSKKKQSRRLKPRRVIADKGYDDDRLRAKFASRGIDFVVPYRANRVNRFYENGRKLRCYRRHWKMEWANAWLKNFRRRAVRWDRSLIAYKGFVHIARICITPMRF